MLNGDPAGRKGNGTPAQTAADRSDSRGLLGT